MKRTFYIAGGDERMVHLANALALDGEDVSVFALDGAGKLCDKVKTSTDLRESADHGIVILPLPVSDANGFLTAPFAEEKYRLSKFLETLHPGTVLFGGKFSAENKEAAKKRELLLCDYYEREEFTVRNASLTAEAAVALSLELLKESIRETPVLILGHGRIGRLLLAMLKALDADVTVAARRFSDLAWIRSEGGTPLEFCRLKESLGKFRVIFNTVPAPVLGREELMLARKDAILIDLASAPGGIDIEAAQDLGLNARMALGLPGKFAPKTAGEIIRDTNRNELKEREVL